jgi:hypothetical protein
MGNGYPVAGLIVRPEIVAGFGVLLAEYLLSEAKPHGIVS